MGTILKPEEMAERMKTISDNIRTIMEIRPIKAPRYSDIIEKAKDRIDAKMEEIGKTGIKRNRTPDNTPQNHNKKPKNTPQGSQTPEYQTDVTSQTSQSANYRARKRKSAENEQYNEEAREKQGAKGKRRKITKITQASKIALSLEKDKTIKNKKITPRNNKTPLGGRKTKRKKKQSAKKRHRTRTKQEHSQKSHPRKAK